MIRFVLLISNFLLSFTHAKVAGGTEADLRVRARQTQLYVCRVNDKLGNSVFSDWVKVKVLDIDKTGLQRYFNVANESDVVIVKNVCRASASPLALHHRHLNLTLSLVFHHQGCRSTGMVNRTLQSTQNPK